MKVAHMPRCATCGRFTTHMMVRSGSSASGYYEEVEDWYCQEHEPKEA